MKEFLMCFGLSAAGITLYILITIVGSIILHKMFNDGEDPSLEDTFGGAWVIGALLSTGLIIHLVVNYIVPGL